MALLDLPGRHHPLHVLGVLTRGDEKRFGELVKINGHHDAEIARALEYLKKNHFVHTAAEDGLGSLYPPMEHETEILYDARKT